MSRLFNTTFSILQLYDYKIARLQVGVWYCNLEEVLQRS